MEEEDVLSDRDRLLGTLVAGRYQVVRKVGEGSFGRIYSARDNNTGGDVAVKFEKIEQCNPQLQIEFRRYKALAGGPGIPNAYWHGVAGNNFALVMDSLGPSLEDLFNFCKRQFSLRTVCLLALQLLTRLEFVHSRSIIHRDIKPDNFLMGRGPDSRTVYVVDFGLSKRFRDQVSGQHIPYREGKSLTGTARYASLNTHLGKEQSRRDDLESLGFVLTYFARGQLPWQGIKGAKQHKYERIKETKKATPIETLCFGLPHEFVKYFAYCRNLKYEEKPDYSYLRALFQRVLTSLHASPDAPFDWQDYSCPTESLRSSTTTVTRDDARTHRRKMKKWKDECAPHWSPPPPPPPPVQSPPHPLPLQHTPHPAVAHHHHQQHHHVHHHHATATNAAAAGPGTAAVAFAYPAVAPVRGQQHRHSKSSSLPLDPYGIAGAY